MKIYSMVAQTRQHLRKEGTTPDDLYSQLERRGYQVDIGYAEDFLLPLNRLKVEYDLYILKSHDDLWLSLASILHSMEANIVNPYPSCVVSENKIVATQRMQCAGIPVPDTWITANFDHLRKLVAKQPLLIKPHIGGMGRSELIRRVNTEQELTKILPPCDTYFVQAYVSNPRDEDLKVYVIGDDMFTLRKPSAMTNFNHQTQRCPVSDDVRSIAQRCGQIFGLGLFGLDIIESPHGPVVVDINYFPAYRGIPKAGNLIASYIDRYVRGEHSLMLPDLDSI